MVRVELVRDSECEYAATEVKYPQHLVEVVRHFLRNADREVFLAVNLSGRLTINSIHVVSVGDLTHSIAHPREVFKAAILANAASIALAHNHPSAEATPSDEDIKITRKLIEAGKILDINVIDHIIIAGDSYLSFSEKHIGGF